MFAVESAVQSGQKCNKYIFTGGSTCSEQASSTQLRDDLMTMLIAGHETAASTLTWAVCPSSPQAACSCFLRQLDSRHGCFSPPSSLPIASAFEEIGQRDRQKGLRARPAAGLACSGAGRGERDIRRPHPLSFFRRKSEFQDEQLRGHPTFPNVQERFQNVHFLSRECGSSEAVCCAGAQSPVADGFSPL